jgi:hypothetical protein
MKDNALIDEIIPFSLDMTRYWTEGWREERIRQTIHQAAVVSVPITPGRP